jgi:quinolinate synthase
MAAVFPSLIVRPGEISAQGSFAEAQAEYLDPDLASVDRLEALLGRHRAGVVSHFYMDAELQGILYAVDWPHVHVSDSLKMADAAIEMVENGAETIIVLGVDFMSENVRAMLDAAGHSEIPVLRVSREAIGCSLAESAESREYAAYLEQAAKSAHPLHVVYINTSLRTKARAHHRVPTITCTSSNVVQTVLQASAQKPDVDIWFGPDTYMGRNLREMFVGLAELGDATIKALHPAHDAASIRGLVERFHHFQQGTCIVHHLFGREVVEQVREHYPDAFITAHLEVPGEMFALGLEAQQKGRGVVGSTSDILGFITARVHAAVEANEAGRLQFVLGTEAGMVTAIVRQLRAFLSERPQTRIEVEIIFPVAAEAVAATDDAELPLVPGVAGGEGCSTAGGCATCPYMKMNSFDAMIAVLEEIGRADLSSFEPRKYQERIAGHSVAELGGKPILHMRDFQRTGELGADLLSELEGHQPKPA